VPDPFSAKSKAFAKARMFGFGRVFASAVLHVLRQHPFHEALRIAHVAKAKGSHGVIKKARVAYEGIGRGYLADIVLEIFGCNRHGRASRRSREPPGHVVGDRKISREGAHSVGMLTGGAILLRLSGFRIGRLLDTLTKKF
jgi:hypothetical protein